MQIDENARILQIDKLTPGHEIYGFWLHSPRIAAEAAPGQTVYVRCDGKLLRRPFGVCMIRDSGIYICFEVRGEGTAWLATRGRGDILDIMGPGGNGFDVSDTSRRAIVVGGGIGIFPLLAVAQHYAGKGARDNITAVCGFRDESYMMLEREFAKNVTALHITTDDGSAGTHGFATDVMRRLLDETPQSSPIIYACGPRPMMAAAAGITARHGVRCQVSLEERMGCGVGACLACVCETIAGKKTVCKDGPVFEAGEIVW